ncbi:MAG: tRNA lysidine(34) synthetase TilS [Firmicutes bacterium]|jgi:tRNA(Ile)-lysidine synthase|nr:tRNA lysidine(34) synthetase TilS [Bacillota bacterium]
MNFGKDRFIKDVKFTIKRFAMFAMGDQVIVGVSGGPDSVALLHVLYKLQNEFDISLHVAHLNHMLRGEIADEEARYVKDFAKRLGLSCTIESIDVRDYAFKKSISTELAARDLRYDFYMRTAIREGASKVALGHHAGDQAETVLLRLIRGTGLTGLRGIPAVRPLNTTRNITIVRPLIELVPSKILTYCNETGLKYYIDASNINPDYSRNRIRHELIPRLEQDYNPKVIEALVNTAELIQKDEDYMIRKTKEKFKKVVEFKSSCNVVIKTAALNKQHVAIQRRIIRQAVLYLTGKLDDFQFIHVESILKLAASGKTGSVISLPEELRGRLEYGRIIIERTDRIKPQTCPVFEYKLKIPGKTEIPEACTIIEANVLSILNAPGLPDLLESIVFTGNDEAYFDMDIIDEDLTVRNRRPGDRLSPLGMKGHKKLKDIFIDGKIPRNIRDCVPVIVWRGKILWVAGICMDGFAKLTPATQRVLHLRTTRRYRSCDQ